MKDKIKVAIVGLGNCAQSLIEGVSYYQQIDTKEGIAFYDIGGYTPKDIEFVLAYDIDERKVGEVIDIAMYSEPNCAWSIIHNNFLHIPQNRNIVQMGRILDGVAPHMNDGSKNSFQVSSAPELTKEKLIQDLIDNKVDVLLNYLPVGSQEATEFYLNACIEAKVPFVNCIPVFIVSDKEWQKKIYDAGIPAIGDDMRSACGASVMSQMLQELFMNRGLKVNFHCQTNEGGNTDFRNMNDASRLKSKKISKENVIASQNELRNIPVEEDSIYAGPSAYIPYLGDNKVAHFRLEAEGFGGAPYTFDARLSVQDSPNSAGVVIDAIRFLQVAREMGMRGPLYGASAFTQKTPPKQMMFDDSYKECEALAKFEWTKLTTEKNNS